MILAMQLVFLLVSLWWSSNALDLTKPTLTSVKKASSGWFDHVLSRRSILCSTSLTVALTSVPPSTWAAKPNGLSLTTSPSGLKWTDAKIGTGQPLNMGSPVSMDYSMASTAGRFPQIYTTKDKDTPYRWRLGDGSTIAGIEKAIVGDPAEGIPPMLPGGIRRVIIPSTLGYQTLAAPNTKCLDNSKLVGPIPPNEGGAYQRWAEFYCNPRIPYQPDLVFDIKLYGRR